MGKWIYVEIDIGLNVVLVSYVVVEFVKKIFGNFLSKYILIFGVGKMGEFVVENLYG